MPESFSLSSADYKFLERAAIARFQRHVGRLNIVFFAQVFAWMFITMAVVAFFKLYQHTPDDARPYGVIVLFAVLGFLLACAKPLAGHWLYGKYIASSNQSFTSKQTVWFEGGSLMIESASGKASVPASAIIDHSQDARNHYLFLTGVQAITIPKAVATALGADFTAFIAASASEA
jgi:hypothetical protein